MTGGTAWFERKFAFPVPEEQFPLVLARLRGTPARLEEIVRGRAEELLIRREGEKWSAQEHAGHLADLDPLWLARVDDYAGGNRQLTAADLTNRKTHEAQHNSRSLEEILQEFRVGRQALLERVAALGARLPPQAIPHPRLGTPMRLVDHLYFAAEHDDHHLGAIRALLNGGTPICATGFQRSKVEQ